MSRRRNTSLAHALSSPPSRCAGTRRKRWVPRAVFLWHAGDDGSFGDDGGKEDDDSASNEDGDDDEEDSEEGEEENTDGRDAVTGGGKGEGGLPRMASSTSSEKAVPEDNPLYEAIRRFDPDDVESIQKHVSDDAVEAMRRTLLGTLGNLPNEIFEVQISSEKEGLRRLLFSSLMTGYALRNAEFRMTLSEGFSRGGSSSPTSTRSEDENNEPDSPSEGAVPDYMRQVPLKTQVLREDVSGCLTWWDAEQQSKCEMDANSYISRLEAEIELLRDKLDASEKHDQQKNKVLSYMRTLSLAKIAALQHGISDAASKAMKGVVAQLLGVIPNLTYSISRDYLAQLTFWCLMVGYHIRDLEKRQEILDAFNASGETVTTTAVNEDTDMQK